MSRRLQDGDEGLDDTHVCCVVFVDGRVTVDEMIDGSRGTLYSNHAMNREILTEPIPECLEEAYSSAEESSRAPEKDALRFSRAAVDIAPSGDNRNLFIWWPCSLEILVSKEMDGTPARPELPSHKESFQQTPKLQLLTTTISQTPLPRTCRVFLPIFLPSVQLFQLTPKPSTYGRVNRFVVSFSTPLNLRARINKCPASSESDAGRRWHHTRGPWGHYGLAVDGRHWCERERRW